jgi:hypothetical protein
MELDSYMPFDSVNNDRLGYSADLAQMFSRLFTNGVLINPATCFKVTADNGLTIALQPGTCNINGRIGTNSNTKTIELTTANGTWARIDRVVLRLDITSRLIEVDVLVGTPAATPTAPALTRTETIYELGIADIRIPKGATSIQQSNITDTRGTTTLCGYIQPVNEVDTTDLFTQFSDAFYTWFDSVKGVLIEEETAGNLLNLINENTTAITATNARFGRVRRFGAMERTYRNFLANVYLEVRWQDNAAKNLNVNGDFCQIIGIENYPEECVAFTIAESGVYRVSTTISTTMPSGDEGRYTIRLGTASNNIESDFYVPALIGTWTTTNSLSHILELTSGDMVSVWIKPVNRTIQMPAASGSTVTFEKLA